MYKEVSSLFYLSRMTMCSENGALSRGRRSALLLAAMYMNLGGVARILHQFVPHVAVHHP